MVATPAERSKRYNRAGSNRLPPADRTIMTEKDSARPTITAVILAGGSGSRLGGVDKALLSWRGQTFIEQIVERVTPQVTNILINSNRTTRYPGVDLPVIADPWPEQRGPLAGLLAGLDAASEAWVLFLPCDCPQPAADLVQRLWAAVIDTHGDTDIAYAGIGADSHYLFCLVRRSLRDDLRQYLLQGGSAVYRWMSTQRSCRVAFDDEAEAFLNINSTDELDALRNTP